MLRLQARVDLGVMAIKEYSTFPKVPALLKFSPSDCLVSYPEHSLGDSYPSAEMQSVYSAAPADWANGIMVNKLDCQIIITDYEFDFHRMPHIYRG